MACGHPPIPRSPGKNWIERVHGHIPQEIECVARALYWGNTPAKGDKQRAYHMAVGIAEDWAAGTRTKDPKTIAKYKAAVAKWKALIAKAHAS